ncbi:uncharacterized protein VTP21DRAFT_1540 [Calcarisporiella thermophila]|uniref:uncharacterized protein n=1 Tax=Calcarisporiella thermophila TaxID=911321 RepID=UPI00374440BE
MFSSLELPVFYLAGWVGAMALFSFFWRRRKIDDSQEPWFGPHYTRDEYVSLLNIPDVPVLHLKSALLRRAEADLWRLVQIGGDKEALSQLVKSGAVGDGLWQELLAAEGQLQEELKEVIEEANTYEDDWGRQIFQQANEMLNHGRVNELKTLSKQMLLETEGVKVDNEKSQQLSEDKMPLD